jgi:hypothetical protein
MGVVRTSTISQWEEIQEWEAHPGHCLWIRMLDSKLIKEFYILPRLNENTDGQEKLSQKENTQSTCNKSFPCKNSIKCKGVM